MTTKGLLAEPVAWQIVTRSPLAPWSAPGLARAAPGANISVALPTNRPVPIRTAVLRTLIVVLLLPVGGGGAARRTRMTATAVSCVPRCDGAPVATHRARHAGEEA